MWKSFLSKTEEEEEELIVSKSDFNRYVRFFNMKARRRNERRNERTNVSLVSQSVSQSDSLARLLEDKTFNTLRVEKPREDNNFKILR